MTWSIVTEYVRFVVTTIQSFPHSRLTVKSLVIVRLRNDSRGERDDLRGERDSGRNESRSPHESFRPYSRSPRVFSSSFINSALKIEIWKIPLQIFVFWML
jgi:hypothetical protein